MVAIKFRFDLSGTLIRKILVYSPTLAYELFQCDPVILSKQILSIIQMLSPFRFPFDLFLLIFHLSYLFLKLNQRILGRQLGANIALDVAVGATYSLFGAAKTA